MSLLVLLLMPFLEKGSSFKGLAFYPLGQIIFWRFVVVFCLLTWIGIRPVEEPYVIIGQWLTVVYFGYFLINPWIVMVWQK
jgi:ubiquinol-cytochrome c reductase cytochrome b subunit